MNSTQSIVLGGGCFWCIEAVFQRIRGIASITSGYAGGSLSDPSYEQVCTGQTGHAEVVQLEFDPSIISLPEILDIFFHLHNPTTLNRQGADVGSQYRSIVMYSDEVQKQAVEQAIAAAQPDYEDPIVTQVQPLETFYRAEEYHQNYFNTQPTQGYCQVVISPKLSKLYEKYADKTIK